MIREDLVDLLLALAQLIQDVQKKNGALRMKLDLKYKLPTKRITPVFIFKRYYRYWDEGVEVIKYIYNKDGNSSVLAGLLISLVPDLSILFYRSNNFSRQSLCIHSPES